MAGAAKGSAVNPLLADTERAQATASDPLASAWVSANAGAGKTHVLKLRVLKLLLTGTLPERILCLTYTKAAAAEMSQRVYGDLAQWAVMDAASLAARLAGLLGRPPSVEERDRARQLFARAIETPGGLKVQTIHAFCERLLQRFPLEAGVPPGFSILDDEMSHTLSREAIDQVLAAATSEPGSDLGRALECMIAFAADDGFDAVLRDALSKPEWLDGMARVALRPDEGRADIARIYRSAFGLDRHTTLATIDLALGELLPLDATRRIKAILAGGSPNDQKAAARFAAVLAPPAGTARIEALARALLTDEDEPRKAMMTKALCAAHPEVESQLAGTQARFAGLYRQRRALALIAATEALLRLTGAVKNAYSESKARRAALDFDDLIVRTSGLLVRSDAADWVLYKLDGGLDHILVDEAQDTSPLQWSVVTALAREFFAGAGTREEPRTVFAVGDEKQSIYSFQGAAPKMFAETGDSFAALAQAAGQPWRKVPLLLSFRTVAPLLDAVDRVFADRARTPGLTADAAAVRHVALRTGQAGFVEIWPTEAWEEGPPSETWAPLGEVPQSAPVNRLAGRIADTIARWLKTGERLVSEDRPIRAGDILILVRRRNPFAGPMVAALKARGIPVAGADRIRITEQIAVADLIALGDVLTLPEDDLALAVVLKSPLFDLTDDDLLVLTAARKSTLWRALLEVGKTSDRLRPAADALKRWRGLADYAPPYEFYARLLDKDGVRARLLARLGPEATDPIDEFLSLALGYDDDAPPSLQGFLCWVRGLAREIKRDMEHGRNEVRILTVHGAKGLEAPIVFLPDTCSTQSPRRAGTLLAIECPERPEGITDVQAWPVKGTSRLEAIRAARQGVAQAEAEERNRLLYVALTRARDRLYVAGFEGKRGRSAGCWHDLVMAGLDGRLARIDAPDGRTLWRLAADQTAPHDPPRAAEQPEIAAEALPAWARTSAPREPQLAVPLAPSRLVPLEIDDEGEVAASRRDEPARRTPAAPSPLALAADYRFLRGTLTHALLEHLPTIDPGGWERAARAFIDLRARDLPARTRAGIVAEALAVLRDPAFAPVFGPASRAEVPIAAEIPHPTQAGKPPLRITGQLDRVAELGHEILIVDYKTNRPPPREPAGVAAAYLYQLAAYRLAAKEIFGTSRVRCAILWTDGPRLMPIPESLLADHERRLWELDTARLDG